MRNNKTILYKNGINYIGHIKNGKIHGKGNFDFGHDYKYKGFFYKGFYTNTGELSLNNGQNHIFKFKQKEIIKIGVTFADVNMELVSGFFYIDKNQKLYLNGKTFFDSLENCLIFDCAGNKYKGSLKNGLFHGEGSLIYENGNEFCGKFENGLRLGFGRYFLKDAGYFEGDFNEDGLIGQGKYILPNKTTLEGTFKNDFLNGKGKIKYFDETVILSKFSNGRAYGKGTISINNKEYNFKIDEKNCQGMVIFEDILKDKVYLFLDDGTISLDESIYYEREIKGRAYFFNGDVCYSNFKNQKMNGDSKIFYANSDIYEGKLVDNVKHGYGRYCDFNKDIYEGKFKKGYYNGKGILTYHDGNKYDGKFLNGLFHGFGVYYLNNENRYECEFKNGAPNGYGSFYYKNGDYYEGQFKDWLFSGKGNYFNADGGRYCGDFYDSFFQGNAEMIFKDKSSYCGEFFQGYFYNSGVFTKDNKEYDVLINEEFVDGIGFSLENNDLFFIFENAHKSSFNGKAKIYFSNGSIYEGEIVQGQFNGYGELSFSYNWRIAGDFLNGNIKNGKIYDENKLLIFEGEFNEDTSFKSGTRYYENGDIYKGEFLDGLTDGYGIYKYENGDILEGEFENGFIFNGRIEYKSGIIYEGEMENMIPHGIGTKMIFENTVYEGSFLNGAMDGYGTIFYGNGNKFIGEFKDNHIEGKGTYSFKDNSKWEGSFKKNINGRLVLTEGIKYNKHGEIEEEIDSDFFNIFDSKGE